MAAGLLVLAGLALPRPAGGGEILVPLHALLAVRGHVVLRIVTGLSALSALLAVAAAFPAAWRGRGVLYTLLGAAPFATRWALTGDPGLPVPLLLLVAGFAVYLAALWTAAQLPRNAAAQKAHLSGGTVLLVGLGAAVAAAPPAGEGSLLAPGVAFPLCLAVAAVVISFAGSCSEVLSHRLGRITRLLCYAAAALFLAGRIFRSGGGDPFYEAAAALPWTALAALAAVGISDFALDLISTAAHARDRENFDQMLGYLERYRPDARFGSRREPERGAPEAAPPRETGPERVVPTGRG